MPPPGNRRELAKLIRGAWVGEEQLVHERGDGAVPHEQGRRWRQIVDQICAGDAAGQQALYDTFGSGLRFYFSAELRTDDVDDKVHDTFVAIVSAIRAGHLRDPLRLAGYVRAVAHHQATTYLTRTVQARNRCDELTEDLPLPDHGRDPEQEMVAQQEQVLVRQVLHGLPEEDREILVRYYLEEQSGEQICSDLRLDATQFRFRKYRAKRRFLGALGKLLKRKKVPREFLFSQKATSGY